jgi:hypothetical protein
LKTPRFVETSDDTTHPITQISKVQLSMQYGHIKYLKDVLYVPTITKKLISVSQMVEQGLQVTFNPNWCFFEDMNNQCKLIAKGRMFTLDVNMHEVNSMLFTNGKGARDIRIWHKLVGHVNLQCLKLMEKKVSLEVFPNVELKRWCQKFMKHVSWRSKLGIYSQLKQFMWILNLWKRSI